MLSERKFRASTAAGLLAVGASLPLSVPVVQAQPALEEVMVTAQRRSESLQDAPISLSAFNSEALEKSGVDNLLDIRSLVPNLTIDFFPLNNQTLRIFIRGIGILDTQVTQDPAIGVYMDGVYIARSTGLAFDLAELERIEVLRGPQGTLYGRNSTGGTINLITKRPDPTELSIYQKFGGGSHNLFSSKTSVNLPVADNAAVKLAYLDTRQDGFIRNTGPGGDFGDREVNGYRLDATWDISAALQLDYSYDNSEVESFSYTPAAITAPTPMPGNSPDVIFFNRLAENSQQFYDYPGRDERPSSQQTPVPLLPSNTWIKGHSLTLTADVWRDYEIKYLGAYRELDDRTYADMAASGSLDYRVDNGAYTSRDGSLHVPAQRQLLMQEQQSHELQLSGDLFDERMEFITGIYYFRETGRDSFPRHHQLSGIVEESETALTRTVTSLLQLDDFETRIENEAYALFAQATWTPPLLQERLRFTLGVRHSRDRREADRNRVLQNLLETEVFDKVAGTRSATPPTPAGPANQFNASGSKEFRDNSVTFVANYDISDSVGVYAKYAEAYKSGGFNTREPDPEFFTRGFDEEKVESIELGLKSELFNRRLRANAAVFHTDFTDMQMNFKLPGLPDTRVFNAGESRLQGVELDITWLLSADLVLTANSAYLDAEIREVTDPQSGEDATDDFVFFSAPRLTWNLGVDYTVAHFSWGRLGLNLNYSFMDDINNTALANQVPRTRVESYGLLGGRLGFYDIPVLQGELTAALWGKNLRDEEYVVTTFPFLPHNDRGALFGEPRSVGVDLIYRY